MSVDPMARYEDLYQPDDEEVRLAPVPEVEPAPPARRTSWSAAELLATDFPPPKWAVPGVVAEGLNLLAGAPKLGKSWLVLNLAVAVASGGRAFGTIPVDEGDVLYLALEDTPRRLKDRLGKVLAGGPGPDRLRVGIECETLTNGGADRIDRWCTAHPGARLVIVDTLAKVKPQIGGRVSAYDADYHAVGLLKAIADAHGVSMVLVHHTRKMAAEDFIDAVSGTQGLNGAADATMVLARFRGSADAVLKVTGRDIEEADHPLAWDPQTWAWRMLAGPTEDYSLGDTRRRILHHLRDIDTPDTPKAIAAALGLDYELTKKTARRMVDDGQLDTDGAGRYFPPSTAVPPVPAVPVPITEGHQGHEGHTSPGTT